MTTLALAMVGFFGAFGRLGALQKKSSGGGGTPVPGTPTYYIYGF